MRRQPKAHYCDEHGIIVHHTHDIELAKRLALNFDIDSYNADNLPKPVCTWLRISPAPRGVGYVVWYAPGTPGQRGTFAAVEFPADGLVIGRRVEVDRVTRILLTGSRDWNDILSVVRALLATCEKSRYGPIVLVHGDCPRGADRIADETWQQWHRAAPDRIFFPERHPADWKIHGKYAGPLRNNQMVSLGADVCLAFAQAYASGTGHCARAARKAGIPVLDYGVSTLVKEVA